MKRLLIILLAVLFIGLFAGVTYSIFSDTESINNNVIEAGEVDIVLQALTSGVIDKPLDVSNLIPTQWTDYARAEIYNEDYSSDVRVFMYIDNVVGDLCDYTNLQVTTGAIGTDVSERGNDVFDGALLDLEGTTNKVEVTGYVATYLSPLETIAIQQRAQIDESAGNDMQAETCTWDEVFVAETPVL